ncbi:MAG: hypothetical protein IJ393_07480, partial [Clostridia bacterium]|nr:hypothetical protein [Clostridia bacterium]
MFVFSSEVGLMAFFIPWVVSIIAFIVFLVLVFKTASYETTRKRIFGVIAGLTGAFFITGIVLMAIPPKAYQISTPEDLIALEEYADGISVGFHANEGKKAELTNDIDFEGFDFETINLKWNDVCIDGNGYTIKNITYTSYEENEEDGIGLFIGDISLKNITFENIYLSYHGQTSSVGGFVGVGGDIFENVTISGKIDAPNATNVGGMVGEVYYDTKIINCTSEMEINGKMNVGGFVGFDAGGGEQTLKNCKNLGTVKGSENVGGIIGKTSVQVSDCENLGEVKGSTAVGGIVGYVNKGASVSNSKNSSAVTGNIQVGGIAGFLLKDARIDDCVNLEGAKVTGISADSDGNSKVGGIVGETEKETNVYNCKNQGEVASNDSRVGGIVGFACGSITNCKHEGSVVGGSDVGGIVGNYKSSTMISTCEVTGSVTGNTRVGGIIGRIGSDNFRTKLNKWMIHLSY